MFRRDRFIAPDEASVGRRSLDRRLSENRVETNVEPQYKREHTGDPPARITRKSKEGVDSSDIINDRHDEDLR
jgi:hypothetical protein